MNDTKTLYTDMDIKIEIDGIMFSVLNIIFERFQRSIAKHSHGHGSYEMHFIPNGYGTAYIDGELYNIVPNTFYMTGPFVEHEQIPNQDNAMEEYCIYFNLQSTSKPNSALENSIGSIFEKTHFWFGQDTQNLRFIFEQIFNELEHRYIGYMVVVESLLKQCIARIVRNYVGLNYSQKHFSASNLSDSKYIVTEESFLYEYNTLTLRKLSDLLGLSTRQTERFLKETYGKTFLEKQTEAKMSVAITLLADKTMSITEISEVLNYSSIQHFSFAFKRYYGCTPSAYRKSLANTP